MRRCGEVRVVRGGGEAALVMLRDLAALLLSLGFAGFLILMAGGA